VPEVECLERQQTEAFGRAGGRSRAMPQVGNGDRREGRAEPTQPLGLAIRPWRDLPTDDLLAIRPAWDAKDLAERIKEIRRHGDEWIIATVDGEGVGWIVLRWRGKQTHPEYPDMEDIYVNEAWRGRGIGTALIGFVEGKATRRGHLKLGLAVNPTRNKGARALYERLGYEHTGGTAYLDGVYDGNEDWVIDLEKKL
jgi:GNAT superfamily N-acetyltransferase